MTPYLISKFQKATLTALIRECFGYEFSDILKKPQVEYIFNYLSALGAASVLLEPEYIDRDFLEDYSRYYVKRFGNDGYVCGRLHFFRCGIDHQKLDKLLLSGDHDGLTLAQLQDDYLGFVVVKPLTKTFVGKSCLRIGDDLGNGKKKISKRYDVSLFGLQLSIDSIAFQEQDKVVSACATTAIWTALHALPWRDVRDIPSCSEITTAAINFVDGSSNGFPNSQLSNKQIQRSLDVEGLRYHTTTLTSTTQELAASMTREWFKTYVASHIDSGLPILVTGTVYGISPVATDAIAAGQADGESTDSAFLSPVAEMQLEEKAGHAITVLGYDLQSEDAAVYVHDDRLGPFAKARLLALDSVTAQKLKIGWGLAFCKKNEGGEWADPHEILIPDLSLIAAEKKARLPYAFAYGTASLIHEEASRWMESVAPSLESEPEPLSFSIRLATIAKIRELARAHSIDCSQGVKLTIPDQGAADPRLLERWNEDKLKFLTTPLARLQWEIDFALGSVPVFKVLIDATDIPLGNAVSALFLQDPVWSKIVLEAFKEQRESPVGATEQQFYSSFLSALKRRDDDYESHLNTMYGALRAPTKLEDSEVGADGAGKNPTARNFFDPSEESLATLFADVVAEPHEKNLIWAIGRDGSLFVAEDLKSPKLGHPSMTGLQAARIAGEMWWDVDSARWGVNWESGRYSRDYATPDDYLTSAIRKIASFFGGEEFYRLEPRRPISGAQGTNGETAPTGSSGAA
ncbi:hypothetical protein NP444_03625 [Pseudomonas aeruginosa]|uniref:hypothetical protein n=1 Tax=Pseudomonas aeruginosa TaxID=287 RepID=UPI0021162513|nr:hypothetical protein [Pseudomonas aeruginosa]UUH88017.1 hypothetical protein NP444_03625 [Pseudomonas aeruginosa]HCR1326669.1 hypothetical protein [Pseudomonas aeruginosa]